MFSCWLMSNSLWPMDCILLGFPVLHYLPEFAQTPFHWVSDAIQPSHPLSPPSSALNLFQNQGFLQSQAFATGNQSIGVSASALVLPVTIQGWFPLGLTGLLSLLCKGLSRVFSSTTVCKHQFCGAQSPLWTNSHICKWPLEKTIVLTLWIFVSVNRQFKMYSNKIHLNTTQR